MRFSIRDVLWLTVVVALAVGWWLDRGVLARTVADAQKIAHETEIERADWERRTQMEAVAHNQTLRVIEESGLAIVSKGNKRWLQKKWVTRDGFIEPPLEQPTVIEP